MYFLLKPSRESRSATTAALTVSVDDEVVWPIPGAPDVSLEIPIDDLLSHLVEFWEPLALRQTYPLPVATTRPSELRARAESRWEEQSAEVAEREDAALVDFEEAHDLSRCFAGYFDIPPLWLLRRGEKMIVDTLAGLRFVEYSAALAELTRLGDEIAGRLSQHGERWSRLIDLWRRREAGDPLTRLAWATGLSRNVADGLSREGLLAIPSSFAEIADDNDELRIAARMAGALPPDQIRAILKLVGRFPKYEAPMLDELAREVFRDIADRYGHRRAYEQGEGAARHVREKLGLRTNQVFDVADVLERLGVGMEFRVVDPPGLRALAIDGRRHGPFAFVNMKAPGRGRGQFPRSDRSARVDLAHEFCHLLLDRGHALGAVEVLNSRMPLEIEQRAKSFAGELLAPTAAVASFWERKGSPRTLAALEKLLLDIQKVFGVTKSVASWKLQHATQNVDVDVSRLLDQIAPER